MFLKTTDDMCFRLWYTAVQTCWRFFKKKERQNEWQYPIDLLAKI